MGISTTHKLPTMSTKDDPAAALRCWRERWLPESIDPRPWASRCGYGAVGVPRVRLVFTASPDALAAAGDVLDRDRNGQPWDAIKAHPGEAAPYLGGMALVDGEALHVEGRGFGRVAVVDVVTTHGRGVDRGAHHRAEYRFACAGAVLPLVAGERARRSMRRLDAATLASVDRTIVEVPAEVDALGLTDEDRADLAAGAHALPVELLAAGLARTPADVRRAMDALGLDVDRWDGAINERWLDPTPSKLGAAVGFSAAWVDLSCRTVAAAVDVSVEHARQNRHRLRSPWDAWEWLCEAERRARAPEVPHCPVCGRASLRLVGQKAGEPACESCYQQRRRDRRNKGASQP